MLVSYYWLLIWCLVVFISNVSVFSYPIDERNDIICPMETTCIMSKWPICVRVNSVPLEYKNRGQQFTEFVKMKCHTERIEIYCHSDDHRTFNYLPKYNFGAFDVVQFTDCPLTTNTSMQRVFNRFGIRNVRSLIIVAINASSSSPSASSLPTASTQRETVSSAGSLELPSNRQSHRMFQNLGQLENLELGNFSYAIDGIFRHLINLKRLNLRHSHLQNVSKDFFVGISSIIELEISSSDINALPYNAFEHLVSIKSINLTNNRIDALHSQQFRTNKALQRVRISGNLSTKMTVLPAQLFANLTELQEVWINDFNLTSIPENLFDESFNLQNISLAHNHLREIPGTIFDHQTKLLTLDLSYNDLTLLDDRLFNDTNFLRILHLSYNRLRNISRYLISGLSDLQELYVDNNNLHTIHVNALGGTNVRVLHLQNNRLDFINMEMVDIQNHELADEHFEKVSPFQDLPELQILNMRNNSMKLFLNDWHRANIALEQLDVSHNQIETLDFNNMFNIWLHAITINVTSNKIAQMISTKNLDILRPLSTVTWILNDNPLNCDCSVAHLAAHLQRNQSSAHTKFITDQLKCVQPSHFVNQTLEYLPPHQLICPFDNYSYKYLHNKKNANQKLCPNQCTCYVRSIDSAAVFNCSDANLIEIPSLPNIEYLHFDIVELHIENNNLTTLFNRAAGYKNVNRIFAKNNSIAEIEAEHLPDDLITLDVSANNLQQINATVIIKMMRMPNLQNLSLDRNPWICDCAANDLIKFIENYSTKMQNIDEITCANDNAMAVIRAGKLCPMQQTTVIICIAIIALIFLLTTLYYKSTTLYYKHRQEILVWMFAHPKFAWYFDGMKSKTDDGKEYDVCVLCSTVDYEFVMKKLVIKLEESGFNVCPLMQDMLAGEIIADRIAHCVEKSRRTIVFLTPTFINCFSKLRNQTTNYIDVYGLMGFRMAHKNALDERRARVIVIRQGDIGHNDHLLPEIKAYLNTNIYFQWDEKRFFDKLKLAIVHPKYFKTINANTHIMNEIV